MYCSSGSIAPSQDGAARADTQVRATGRLCPDLLMPPRKKQKQAPTRRSHRLSPSAASADADVAGTHPPSAESLSPSQQAAADAVYHAFLQALTREQMDFVRNDGQWPVVRSSTNKTAKNYDMPRKKGDWHTQRSRFIKEVFLTMFTDSESDEDTLLDLMFNDGKYDWLLDTPRVIRAVQARYRGNTRAKAFTALFQLCEVKCGAYLAESSFDEAFEQAKMVYVDMQKTPNEPPPADSAHMVAMLGCITVVLTGYLISPSTALAAAAVYSAVARARLVKQRAHTALDAGNYDEARSLMITAKNLEMDGFVDTDKERPPPIWEEIMDLCDSHKDDGAANDMLDDDGEILANLEALETDGDDMLDADGTANDVLDEILGSESDISGSDSEGEDTLEVAGQQEEDMLQDNESLASTLTLPSSSDDDEAPTDGLACDYSAGCPTKPYTGRDPTQGEQRDWEDSATAYYQSLLKKYQNAIETLRLEVFEFFSQDNLDVSKFLGRKSALAKKTRVKIGLEETLSYFALATLYGDISGTYEPQRLDWHRAQFTTSLPDGWEMVNGKLPDNNPLPKSCMYVLVIEEQVTMVLRGGNKNDQDVDQDLTAQAPELAAMLRLWMPHTASAQPDEPKPFVIFKITEVDKMTKEHNYGKSFSDGGAYGKLVKRAWVDRANVPRLGSVNPHDDAAKEWEATDRHGFGCGWARTVTSRARRGVVDKQGGQRDDMAAASQGHNASTERAAYRTM